MTLIEFLSPLSKSTHQHRILAVLYYKERYEQIDALPIEEIRRLLGNCRVKGWKTTNITDVLNKAGHLVDTDGFLGTKRLWKLTDSGRQWIREQLGLPSADVEVEHDVGVLQDMLSKIKDNDIHDYINEALKCLQVGALRACVVFVWTGAVRLIHHKMLTFKKAELNAAILKHDPKARAITSVDDFAYIKDNVALLAAKDLGVFDKNEKDTLKEALDLRNRCGHPSKYKPGIKKVSSYIEDIVSIVFN